MTIVKKFEKEKIDATVLDTFNRLENSFVVDYDTKQLQLLYCTQDDLDQLAEALKKFSIDTDYKTPVLLMGVTWTHPISPEPITREVQFYANKVFGAFPAWYPHGLLVPRPDADPAHVASLRAALSDLVQWQQDFTIYKKTVRYIKELSTYEQMRYLFPPILHILREAGLDEIALKMESVRKVPNLPPMPANRSRYIRKAIEWSTIQGLLGRFSDDYSHPMVSRTSSTFSIAYGSYKAEVPDHDGRVVTVQVT